MINEVLKPKTKNDIENSICNLYDIKVDDSNEIEAVCNLHSMVNIKKAENSPYTCYFFSTFIEIKENIEISDENRQMLRSFIVPEDSSTADVDVSIKTIKTTLEQKKFEIKKKIKTWQLIYTEILKTIIKSSIKHTKKIDNNDQIFAYIHMMMNLIHQQTRKGPGNFVILSTEMKKRLNIINFNFIIDDSLENKIVIGRRGADMETNLHLLKYENKYKVAILSPTELKNNYICLECEF
jgi:hypothetical protein